jgi:hypothetical protein
MELTKRMKILPCGLQVMSLNKRFPGGKSTHTYRGLIWSGEVQPIEGVRTYFLKLTYTLGRSPKVCVVSPNLHLLAEGRTIPHMYDQEKQHLCLYRPGLGLWTPSMFLSQTIVPWALTWLIFFELWLATGIWHGRAYGHPGDNPELQNERQW